MPYAVQKDDSKFKVVNTATGEVHARGTTRAKAEAQVRLLRGVEHGMIPKGQKVTKLSTPSPTSVSVRTTREVIEGKKAKPAKAQMGIGVGRVRPRPRPGPGIGHYGPLPGFKPPRPGPREAFPDAYAPYGAKGSLRPGIGQPPVWPVRPDDRGWPLTPMERATYGKPPRQTPGGDQRVPRAAKGTQTRTSKGKVAKAAEGAVVGWTLAGKPYKGG